MKTSVAVLAMFSLSYAMAAGAASRGLHTRFFFSVAGGKSYWTEVASTPVNLGSVAGWSCTASRFDLFESKFGNRASYRTANITCTHPSGAEAQIEAMCALASEDHNRSQVTLASKNAGDGVVLIECYTRRE